MHLLRNHATKLLFFSHIRNSCPELRNIFPRCCGFYDFYQDYLENNTPYTINHTPIHHQPYANTPYTNLHILQFTDDRILPIIRGQNFKYINIYIFISLCPMAVYVWQTANCNTVRNQAFMRIFVLHVNSQLFKTFSNSSYSLQLFNLPHY